MTMIIRFAVANILVLFLSTVIVGETGQEWNMLRGQKQCLEPKKTTPLKKIEPVRISEAGFHYHKCGGCGYVWGHGPSSFGSSASHTCPKCGKLYRQNWIHYMGPR